METTCSKCVLLATEQDERETFKRETATGLSASPKRLSSRFLYDQRGTDLFQKITRLPEYYLTSSELEIIRESGRKIMRLAGGEDFNLVELGSGDGSKALQLIESALESARHLSYLPIDLSLAAMETLTQSVSRLHPGLEVHGIVAEYFQGLEWIRNNLPGRMVVLFLGSNLGNFGEKASEVFLARVRDELAPGDVFVVGLDLRKDVETMTRAYNDAQGVTAQFNLNLLGRINRELGGCFDLDRFQHHSAFDPVTGGMESSLVCRVDQSVLIRELGRTFDFEEGERIHTEHSHKYTSAEINRLAQNAGFEVETNFYDSRRYFVDSVWRRT